MAVTSVKGKSKSLGFSENFLLSGCAAAVSKSSAAPIERVKLLLQNQGELMKQGRLDVKYNGIKDCVMRTFNKLGLSWAKLSYQLGCSLIKICCIKLNNTK